MSVILCCPINEFNPLPHRMELVGTYNPRTNPKTVTVKEEVALKWLSQGAIPSDTVKNILSETGIMKKFADSKNKKSN